jgi:DNA-binding MltR family transcriptional regulator
VKYKEDKTRFHSFERNDEQWNEILNSTARNKVLISGAAIDLILERILEKHLLQESVSKKLISSSLNRFATRINICFALGLISDDEKHDLNILKEIRNSFAHNLFDCDFLNPDIVREISNFKLGKKAKVSPETAGIDSFFNISILVLENLLQDRLKNTISVSKCSNILFGSEI